MRATFQLLAATVSLAATLPRGLEAPVAQVTLQPPAAPGRETFADTLRAEHASLDLRLKDHMTSLPERRRVRFVDPDTGTLREEDITEGEKSLLVLANIQFMDITEEEDSDLQYSDAAAASTFPTQLAYVGKLEGLFSNISLDRMESRLRDFTSFRTRYYRSSEGRHSQAWLLKTIHDIVANGPDLGISVREFEHPWGQNSIILHIPRTAKSHSPDELVIVGAHQDSTNLLPFLNAPGADDDGSGTVTNLEALSLLIASGFRPVNSSVEFHWYSAEEGGMLGSQAIATRYQKDGRSVRAMLQEDMYGVLNTAVALLPDCSLSGRHS